MNYNEISFSDIAEMLRHEDFVYCPNSGNLGDYAIAYGTYIFFEHFFGSRDVPVVREADPERLLVYGGGGALVEGVYEKAWSIVSGHLEKGGRVLVLPHTVVGYYQDLCRFGERIRIICRERISYDLLVSHGFSVDQIFLCDDMAFFIKNDQALFDRFEAMPKFGSYLKALRSDVESASGGIRSDDFFDLSALFLGFPASRDDARSAVIMMLNVIAIHDSVVTDRLHVAVLSSLIGRKCVFFGNSYYKNRAVFDYSIIHRYPKTSFFDDVSIASDVFVVPSASGFLREAFTEYRSLLDKRLCVKRCGQKKKGGRRWVESFPMKIKFLFKKFRSKDAH